MRRSIIRLILVLLVFAHGRDASAQLLSGLINPVVNTLNSVTCSLTQTQPSAKLDSAVRQWVADGGSGSIRVIVSGQPGLLSIVKNLLLSVGATPLGDLLGINAVIAQVDLTDLTSLACASSVSSISLDAVVHLTGTTSSDTAYSLRSTLGVTTATQDGAGVTVAVIDSGIASSADFGNRIAGFFDFTNGAKPTTPSDAYGHGTHVAGLIASTGSLSSGLYQGVAPASRIIGMKVLDGTGAGRTSDVIRAVEYATARRSTLGIGVINLSLGHPIYEPASSDPLVRAIEAASRAGIVVVVSAGNQGVDPRTGQTGYGGITSPGNAPSAITVGAIMTQDSTTRRDDTIAPYSSRGPSWYDGFAKPDIVAPGHGLVSDAAAGSTLYTSYPSARVSSSYIRLSGTSMASGVATGTVALILQANQVAHPGAPPLTPNVVKAILQYSSLRMQDPSGAEYDALTQGAGGLNAAGAVAIAKAIDPSSPVGSYWWTTNVTLWSVFGSESIEWSQRLVWGTHIVWGTTVDTNESAWSLGTTWGDATTWDNHIVWGTDVVWSDSGNVWSNHIVWGTNYVGTSIDGEHIVWGTAAQPDTTVWEDLN